MSRSNLVLGLLALVQIVVILALGTGGDALAPPPNDPLAGTRPFAHLDVTKLGSFTITEEDGRTLHVARAAGAVEAGAGFVFPDRGGFPVRDTEVETFLGGLRRARVGRVTGTDPQAFTALQVAPDGFARHVVVRDPAGATSFDFYLGEGKRWDTVLWRPARAEVVRQMTGLSTFDFLVDPAVWAVTTLTDLDPATVVELALSNEAGAFRLARGTDAAWGLVAGGSEPIDADRAARLVDAFAQLPIVAPVTEQEASGFGEVRATAVLKRADGSTLVLTLGSGTGEQDGGLVRRADRPWTVLVPAYVVEDTFGTTAHGLVAEGEHGDHD